MDDDKKNNLIMDETDDSDDIKTNNEIKDLFDQVRNSFLDYDPAHFIQNNLTLFRAYVNGYYWIKNQYNDPEIKNLGYYSPMQTELTNYFRGTIIDWCQNKKNNSELNEIKIYMNLKKNFTVDDYLVKLGNSISFKTNTIPELYILSKKLLF